MVRRTLALAFAVTGASFLALEACSDAPSTPNATAVAAFQNAAVAGPSDYAGRRFRLSADYPTQAPAACNPAVCGWLAVNPDFGDGTKLPDWKDGKWSAYVAAMLAYVREGQDPNLANDVGVRTEVGGKTRWFHVPWMAYDPKTGRDFVHGTTNERTAALEDFIGDDGRVGANLVAGELENCKTEWATGFETWAVGVYNEYGGYTFGQIFPRTGGAAGVPQTQTVSGRQLLKGLPFPEGTLVAKFLTTDAPVECVPYLKGAPEWQIHRHRRTSDGQRHCDRIVQTSRILQMDVAVVDDRSPTRWVYTTFVYDGNAPGATFWDRMIPVGVQWGGDSKAFPAVADRTAPILENILNPDMHTYQHAGCNSRMNGPIDNPRSSCMACHGGGFAAPIGTVSQMGTTTPPIYGFAGQCDPQNADQQAVNAAYFSDAPYPAPYKDPKYANTIPLDTSLQLLVALDQFAQHVTAGVPQSCDLE